MIYIVFFEFIKSMSAAYRIIKGLFFAWAIFISSGLSALTLKDRLLNAGPGSYIVTEQNKTYSLLHLHSIHANRVILEEISIPTAQLPEKIHWPQWVKQNAPGNTSWIMYEVDLEKNLIVECFSFNNNAWISKEQLDSFLPKLLNLELKKIPLQEQRRIGPPPAPGEEDHRKIWRPPFVKQGKKVVNPSFLVVRAKWPKVNTDLSEKDFTLYFSNDENIPFPCWMQISDGSNSLKFHAVDCGTNLTSPHAFLPKRPLSFLTSMHKYQSGYKIQLSAPAYFADFDFFAIDLNEPKGLISIPHQKTLNTQEETAMVHIDCQSMNEYLEKGHFYHFIAVPKNHEEHLAESTEPWQF